MPTYKTKRQLKSVPVITVSILRCMHVYRSCALLYRNPIQTVTYKFSRQIYVLIMSANAICCLKLPLCVCPNLQLKYSL